MESLNKLTDGFVNTQDQATGLGGGEDSVDLDKTWLPDKGSHVIPHAFIVKVNTGPDVALPVLDTQPVEDVGGIETGVVAELSWNDFECLGESLDDALLLVGDLCVGVAVEVF